MTIVILLPHWTWTLDLHDELVTAIADSDSLVEEAVDDVADDVVVIVAVVAVDLQGEEVLLDVVDADVDSGDEEVVGDVEEQLFGDVESVERGSNRLRTSRSSIKSFTVAKSIKLSPFKLVDMIDF